MNNLPKFGALDGRQRVFLPVNRTLRQGQIEFGKGNRCGAHAPCFGHRQKHIHRRNPQFEALHIVGGLHILAARCQVSLAVIGDIEHAHTVLGDQIGVELAHQRRLVDFGEMGGIAKAALAAHKVNTRRETEVVMLVSPCR
jgi:hypothetical protein